LIKVVRLDCFQVSVDEFGQIRCFAGREISGRNRGSDRGHRFDRIGWWLQTWQPKPHRTLAPRWENALEAQT
jgi:hypothetical protein